MKSAFSSLSFLLNYQTSEIHNLKHNKCQFVENLKKIDKQY